MKPRAPGSTEAWRLDQGPYLFCGTPPVCAGSIDLINDSDERVKVKALAVVGHDDPTLALGGLDTLRIGVRLAPRRRTRTRAHFLIDARTPPGEYSAELCCGEQRERAVVHVWAKRGVRVDPSRIRLRGVGGDELSAVAVISNEGNVAETMPHVVLLAFQEQRWTGRAMVSAVRDAGVDDGIKECLDRLLRELKATLPRPARVTLEGEASALEPGETREVTVSIKLPNELVKGREYLGWTPFMGTQLILDVECAGAVGSTRRRPR